MANKLDMQIRAERQFEEILAALIESCINAFEHSNSRDRQVTVRYIRGTDGLEFKITDQGVGFVAENRTQRRANKPDLHPEMRKRGLALEILHALMDSVDIMSGENGTTISMVKSKTE